MNREDLLRHCNPDAVYGTRRVAITEGRGSGQRLIEVKTLGGLRASFMEDKCLDILDLEYKGVNLAFLSKNGITDVRHTEGDGFLNYWAGGFLGTCGLRNTGEPCTHNGEYFPFHGRIGLTPAEHINVKTDYENIIISGITRETALFGYRLEMERTITIPTHGAKIIVRDEVRNLTPETEFIFLLYHINFGYPFLDAGLQTKFPDGEVQGRTPDAQKLIDTRADFTSAVDGDNESVFFYFAKEERPRVWLYNPKLRFGAAIEYERSQFPVLSEWKCMRSGDYALGIEPTTSEIRGRAEEIENGYDVKIAPFGTLEYGFTLSIEEEEK